MSVRSICVEPHPILRQKAKPVTAFNSTLHRLVRDLIETMYAHRGIGIAAPQIGCSLQIFITNPSRERGQELVIVNPSVESSRGRIAVTEGCLSVPEFWEQVGRAKQISLRGQDAAGKSLTIKAEGLLAIVLQHEMDHLQGRLFIDRLSWLKRHRLANRQPSHRSHRGVDLSATGSASGAPQVTACV